MVRRKWLVRGVVITIVALCACAVVAYQRFTNAAAVRAMVLAKLQAMFPGAYVSVESARLRLFGGISVGEIHLARADDPDHADIAHIPSAILYHDKEKVLEGELSLRKIELHRPRLNITRRPDGTWNLSDLTGKLKPNVSLPTIVIHNGSLVFEDKEKGSGQAFEVNNIHVTLINDPASVVAIDGVANSDLAGRLEVLGQWQRESSDLALQVKAQGITLSRALADVLAAKLPANALDGLLIDGKADLQANLAYSPKNPAPLEYDVGIEVKDAKVSHPRLPIPLEEMAATLHASNGNLRLERLTARSGSAKVELNATARLPQIDQFFEAHLQIEHLDIRPEIFEKLPEKLRGLQKTYRPTGLAKLKVDVARYDGAWVALPNGEPSRALLCPEDLSIRFIRFDYPLDRMTGTVEHNLLTKRSTVDLTGLANAKPVVIKGYWQGEGAQVDAQFDFRADQIPLDSTLVDALPPAVQKIAASFNATGKADVKGHFKHVPGDGEKDFRHEYHARIYEATAKWDGFRYPLENVSGFLDIFPKSFQFRDFQGTHAGGSVKLKGRSVPVDGKPLGLILEIDGQNIALDETLRQALAPMPGLVKSWDSFRPRGRMHFAAVVDRSSGKNEDMDVRVAVRGGAVEPIFFPYLFQDITGQFRFFKARLDMAKVSASHDKTRITVDKGYVDVHAKGGYYADLKHLEAHGLLLDADFVQAIPQCMRCAVTALNVKEPVDVKTWLVIAQDGDPANPPDFFWDGQAKFKDAKITTGLEWSKVNGTVAAVGRYHRQVQGIRGNILFEKSMLLNQPFNDVVANFQVRKEAPEVLLMGLKAPLFGGDISGQIRADFHAGLKYEMNLTASQIGLADFGRHNLGPKSSLDGQLMGRLYLTGEGGGADTLDGNGSLDVPAGKILDLPFLIDLLKFLGLRWPDRTLFEEMHAMYAIRGRRLAVRRLDLVGNVVSLSGKGEVNLDGTDVQLDFYPTWARLEQLLPPAVRPIPPVISKNLLTIEARGKVSSDSKELKFHKKPVPIIVDPLLNIRDRFMTPPGLDRSPVKMPP